MKQVLLSSIKANQICYLSPLCGYSAVPADCLDVVLVKKHVLGTYAGHVHFLCEVYKSDSEHKSFGLVGLCSLPDYQPVYLKTIKIKF